MCDLLVPCRGPGCVFAHPVGRIPSTRRCLSSKCLTEASNPPLSSSPAFYTCVLGFAYQDKCRAGGGFAADLGPREQVFALLTLHAMRAWGVGFSGEADGATSPQL